MLIFFLIDGERGIGGKVYIGDVGDKDNRGSKNLENEWSSIGGVVFYWVVFFICIYGFIL